MAVSKSKFPQTIYVVWELDGDTPFLTASEDYKELAVMDDTRKVAVYALSVVRDLKAVPEFVTK